MSDSSLPGAPSDAYRHAAAAVVAALGTDLRHGLSDSRRGGAARAVRARTSWRPSRPVPAWRRFLAQFQDCSSSCCSSPRRSRPACGRTSATRRCPTRRIAIFAVVLLNATMGYVQEARAEAAVAALRAMSADEATVVRGGERPQRPRRASSCPATSFSSRKGTRIPADARVVESTALQTAEAALTGESLPVSKDTAPIADEVAARRPAQHGLQRHGRDVRPRHGHRDGDGDADRDGPHRRAAEGDARRSHAAAARARPHRQAARRRRHRHRRRDDRDDRRSSRTCAALPRSSTC